MTLWEAKKRAAETLGACGIEDAQAESALILEAVCGVNLTSYLLKMGDELSPDEEAVYAHILKGRRARVPLQQLTGKQSFMGLNFSVESGVLIPRQDTEMLVREALRMIPEHDTKVSVRGALRLNPEQSTNTFSILDLCTGSGCIAVSVKYYRPEVCVTATDISKRALSLTQKNAEKLIGAGHGIEFLEGDLFDPIQERSDKDGRFDMILANPPYIASGEIGKLDPEVREHEPVGALDGGEDGLVFYRKIFAQAAAYLRPGGHILCEIGNDQGEDVSGIMGEHGFGQIALFRDLAGYERVVRGRLPIGKR